MSAIPPADPGDHAAPDGATVASRGGVKGKRLLAMGALLFCLVGTGAYYKWSAVRDEAHTRSVRALLAADGIAVIDGLTEPDETASPFESGNPVKMVRVQSNGKLISDAELPKIASIRQNLNLVFSACPISNDGLSILEGRSNVRCLMLANTAISDEGIKHFRGMDLQTLDLSLTKITDEGMATLGQYEFPRLKDIALERTRVTNAGLMHLANFKALEWVSIVGTKVTKDGVRHLKAKLPEVTILGGGG